MWIALLERMVKMTQEETKTLGEKVITLHNIARQIEKEIGKGQLAEDLRSVADRLSELLKKS